MTVQSKKIKKKDFTLSNILKTLRKIESNSKQEILLNDFISEGEAATTDFIQRKLSEGVTLAQIKRNSKAVIKRMSGKDDIIAILKLDAAKERIRQIEEIIRERNKVIDRSPHDKYPLTPKDCYEAKN